MDVGLGGEGEGGVECGDGVVFAVEGEEGQAAVVVEVGEVGELFEYVVDEVEHFGGFHLGVFDGPENEEGLVREAAFEEFAGDPELGADVEPAGGEGGGDFVLFDGLGVTL